jgi:hypothetical protein
MALIPLRSFETAACKVLYARLLIRQLPLTRLLV